MQRRAVSGHRRAGGLRQGRPASGGQGSGKPADGHPAQVPATVKCVREVDNKKNILCALRRVRPGSAIELDDGLIH